MITVDMDLKIKFLRAFGDKTRVEILECIKDGEKSVSEIVETVDGNQSNISQHLACLRGCGIITRRQEGKYVYYGLRNEQVRALLDTFAVVLGTIENDVACCNHHMK